MNKSNLVDILPYISQFTSLIPFFIDKRQLERQTKRQDKKTRKQSVQFGQAAVIWLRYCKTPSNQSINQSIKLDKDGDRENVPFPRISKKACKLLMIFFISPMIFAIIAGVRSFS